MMKRFQLSRALVALAVMAATVACTPSKEDQPPKPKVGNAPATAPAATSVAALPKMGPAPRWKVQDVNGKPVSFDEFKGKVVVVDFWATWCPPCKAEIPGYIELQQKYGPEGLVIIGMSIDQGGPDVVTEFAKKTGINYQMLMADEAVVAAFGGIEAVPTTFLIDRNGQIRDRKLGMEEKADYEKKILAVLGDKA